MQTQEVSPEDYGNLKLDDKDILVLSAKEIRLVKNGKPAGITETLTVRMLIDEADRGRADLLVVFIADDGSVVNMNAVREGDYMVFQTGHNSVYAIAAFKPADNEGAKGLTTGAIIGIAAAGVAVLAVFIIILLLSRKKRNGGGNGQTPPQDGTPPDGGDGENIPNAGEDATPSQTGTDSRTANAEDADMTPMQENAVVFVPTEQSFEEAIRALSEEQKSFYDKLQAHAMEVEGAAANRTQSCETIKLGRKTIVRLSIRRATVVAAFSLEHPLLKQYKKHSGEDEVDAIKVKPTEVFVSSAAAFNAAKDMIDIVVKQLAIERDETQRLRKTRRNKQARENPGKDSEE